MRHYYAIEIHRLVGTDWTNVPLTRVHRFKGAHQRDLWVYDEANPWNSKVRLFAVSAKHPDVQRCIRWAHKLEPRGRPRLGFHRLIFIHHEPEKQ